MSAASRHLRKARTATGEVSALPGLAKRVASPEVYSLAQAAIAPFEGRAASLGQRGSRLMAGLHRDLVELAIASSLNIAAARKHLAQALAYTKAAGRKVNEEREMQGWPKEWE